MTEPRNLLSRIEYRVEYYQVNRAFATMAIQAIFQVRLASRKFNINRPCDVLVAACNIVIRTVTVVRKPIVVILVVIHDLILRLTVSAYSHNPIVMYLPHSVASDRCFELRTIISRPGKNYSFNVMVKIELWRPKYEQLTVACRGLYLSGRLGRNVS
jgi:hypothetical protein